MFVARSGGRRHLQVRELRRRKQRMTDRGLCGGAGVAQCLLPFGLHGTHDAGGRVSASDLGVLENALGQFVLRGDTGRGHDGVAQPRQRTEQ